MPIITKYWYLNFRINKTIRRWKIRREFYEKDPLQPGLIGILERTIFTSLIGLIGLQGEVGVALFARIGIKMLTGWNRIKMGQTPYRVLAFNALIGNVTSLLFAISGGVVITKWKIVKTIFHNLFSSSC